MKTEKVLSDKFLNEKRGTGDRQADLFIESIFADVKSKADFRNHLEALTDNAKLSKFQDVYAGYTFIEQAHQLPVWADKKLMTAGTTFYARHAGTIMNLLGLLSLPYCYAAGNGAMVLYLSERIKAHTGQRLFETADFVWDVMGPDAFNKNGKGFSSILKIRLMHAAARYYTLKSGKWDNSWGLPVNQEDMAGTNLSFSLIVIRGLRKFGFSIDYRDQEAFMHLWNVIGYLLGLDNSLLPVSGKQSFELEKAIRRRQFGSSVQGLALTQSLVNYFSTVNTNGLSASREVSKIMRYLLGNEVADLLGLSPGELLAYQVSLLRGMNVFKDFKVLGNPCVAYQQELYKFKQTKP